MRIVAHNAAAALGGGERAPALLLKELQARGHSVLMLCRNAQMAKQINAVADIPTGVEHLGGWAMLPHALRFARRLRAEKPDAVILTTFSKVVIAGLGARLAAVPRIIQRIGLEGDAPTRGPQYRFAFRHFVDAVVLNSQNMHAAFLKADRTLDSARVHTIYNGVDAPVRTRPTGAVRTELGIPNGAAVIGTVARLVSQKRLDRLIRALTELPTDVHCVIAGEGAQHNALISLAETLGVRARVHLLGFRRDIGDVLDAIDLYVVSSDREGMSNAMLEAMAFGIPVVSTPVSGAEESLDPFEDGVAPGVITRPDAADLSVALTEIIQDRPRLQAMGRAARRRAQERFSAPAAVDRWESLLRHE